MVEQDEIIQFVKDRLGFEPTPETKFWWETGVAGLDAHIFLNEFMEHFGVRDADEGQDLDYGDSDSPLADVLDRFWRRMTFRPVPKSAHFTIDHLVEVANKKKWFDPVK